MKNTGVLVGEPKAEDYVSGLNSGINTRNVCEDWAPYLPSTERQVFRYFDSMACVSYSLLNSIETQMNFFIKSGKISEVNFRWLVDSGYIGSDGLFNGSDRALAKMAETTHQGQYMNKVAETARTLGIIPEKDWSWNDEFNWEDYYAPIPDKIKQKGLEFLKRFRIMYEWVLSGNSNLGISLGEHIKHAPIQIAANWWSNPVNGVIKGNGCGSGHATIIYKEDNLYRDFDSYDPYLRSLDKDYCLPWGMKIVIEEIKMAYVDDYAYEIISQSQYISLEAGQSEELMLVLKNTGKKSWKEFKVNLGIPQDIPSIFYNWEWLSLNRPATVEKEIESGEDARFIIPITAPKYQSGKTFRLYVTPVVEGEKWMADRGVFWCITIK